MNAFNTVISELLSINIKITKEDKCISLLCSLSYSWDNLVIATGRNNTTLKLTMRLHHYSEEMRQKTMEGLTPEALLVRGQSINRKKGKSFIGKSKSRGKLRLRSTSPVESMRRCWTCEKPRH